MKRAFSNKLHKTLDELSEFITKEVTLLTEQHVINNCRFDYIFFCSFWTKT